jgi:uncharacterized protein
MSLTVNLRHVQTQSVRLQGVLPPEELDADPGDEMLRVQQPLEYDLEIQKLENSLLVQGRLLLTLDCQCVRCLRPFQRRLEMENWAAHLPMEGEESVPVVNDSVDLTPVVREDILLEFPQHPLCGPECRGLPAASGGEVNKPADTGQASESSAWTELDKLKF